MLGTARFKIPKAKHYVTYFPSLHCGGRVFPKGSLFVTATPLNFKLSFNRFEFSALCIKNTFIFRDECTPLTGCSELISLAGVEFFSRNRWNGECLHLRRRILLFSFLEPHTFRKLHDLGVLETCCERSESAEGFHSISRNPCAGR